MGKPRCLRVENHSFLRSHVIHGCPQPVCRLRVGTERVFQASVCERPTSRLCYVKGVPHRWACSWQENGSLEISFARTFDSEVQQKNLIRSQCRSFVGRSESCRWRMPASDDGMKNTQPQLAADTKRGATNQSQRQLIANGEPRVGGFQRAPSDIYEARLWAWAKINMSISTSHNGCRRRILLPVCYKWMIAPNACRHNKLIHSIGTGGAYLLNASFLKTGRRHQEVGMIHTICYRVVQTNVQHFGLIGTLSLPIAKTRQPHTTPTAKQTNNFATNNHSLGLWGAVFFHEWPKAVRNETRGSMRIESTYSGTTQLIPETKFWDIGDRITKKRRKTKI